MSVPPSQVPRTSGRSPSASAGKLGSIESSSSRFPVQSTASSAPLQRSPTETTITSAEQHNPNLSSTMKIQSSDSPDLRPNKPLIPTPEQAPRPSDRSATNITPTSFQSGPRRSETSTVNGGDSPMSTSSLGLLNLPSDILPLGTETVPPTVSSKALTFPPILTGVDGLLSEVDVKTESPLDWVIAPEPDRPLITSWNALPEMGTHPLGFAPTTTATSLAETLPTPETNIIVPIPTGWSSATQGLGLNQEVPLQAQGSDQSLSTSYTEINIMVSISTGWSSAVQEISLGQEAGSAAHIKPLQAQASEQSPSTPYAHRLSHQ